MELLKDGARALGLHLSRQHLNAFRIHYSELGVWNRRFNLTTITGYEEVQIKHFLDSLTCLIALPIPGAEAQGRLPSVIPISTREAPLLCMDVGTGAGFPGLPLKVVRPSLHMTLLDASRKKVEFLKHVVRCLDLEGAVPLWARAEDVGQDPHHRERYDIVLSRAVADLAVLAEYCLPLCRKGGCFIAQKAANIEAELEKASVALELLGGKLREVRRLRLPGHRDPRSLIVIDKVDPTPGDYPRRPGVPSKRPLTGS
jgi:16S rRNA (guanine527-N7)-methyltransferase